MNKSIRKKSFRPWVMNYDDHIPQEILYPNLSLIDIFDQTANRYPMNQFISYEEFDFSFLEINGLAEKISGFLLQSGLKKGDRVALILPNIPQFVIAFFAILKAGGIVVAMNPNYKLAEFKFLFSDSCSKFVFCLEKHIGLIEELRKENEIEAVVFTSKGETGSLLGQEMKQSLKKDKYFHDFLKIVQSGFGGKKSNFPEILPDDPAIFQYSGGTTGTPKAAIGLHRNLVANVTQFKLWCNLMEGNEKVLAAIPLYHVYGMVLALNMGVAIGANVILVDDPRDVEGLLKEIEEHAITFFPGVPTIYYAINQNERVKTGLCNLKSIKACISGSAPLHPQIKEEFERYTGGKLIEGYGLSEAPTATHCNPLFGKNKSGSIGLPLPDVDCRIVDLETGLSDVEIGEQGELILRGPQIMKGYQNNPKENRITLRKGWLYTGDVVRMDEDGYFYIIDRKKSLIKVGGFQVWPGEIENVLNTHPKVKESAVGGVPDIKNGEKVIAWVVVKDNELLEEKELFEWCEKQLASYKTPSEIYFIDEIPHTGVGKILRRELISNYIKETR